MLLRLHASRRDRPIAQRDEQRAVAAEDQPAAEVQRRGQRRRLVEDDLDVLDLRRRAVDEPAAGDRGVVLPLVAAARRSSSRSADSSGRPDRAPRRAGRPGPRASTAREARHRLRHCLPSALTTRSRPGRSVTSILPSGRNASPHGLARPSATVTTSKATFSFCSGVRVCPANAGFCPWPFGGRVFIPSSGPPPPGPPPRRPPPGGPGTWPPAGGAGGWPAAGCCGGAGCCAVM